MLNKYLGDNRGTFALKFGLMGTFLVMGLGVSIDTTRLVKAKQDFQNAADAATFTAALNYMNSDKPNPLPDANKAGKAGFLENIRQMSYGEEDINFELTPEGTIKSYLDVTLETSFANIFNYPSLDFEISSEVSMGSLVGAEIVLAVDATNSMDFNSNWKNVVQTVNNTLSELEDFTGEDNIYVSVVPFQDRVNIGTDRDNWLASAAPSDWNGCVEPRENAVPGFGFMLDDTRPVLEGFEPNNALTSAWGNTKCPSFPIAGPSSDIEELLEATTHYTVEGTGRFDIGMAWAWRMLSPEWNGLWDVSNYPTSDTKKRKKYLIFMTDARSSAYEREFSQERDWAYNEASIDAFEHLVELCGDIKEDGIEIFVIQFDGNVNADPYFANCASTASHHVKTTSIADVAYPFERILSEFEGEVRLVK